jgi:PAS domain S-box-containing protein
MTGFQFYEKRRYRRVSLQDNDGVYCIISGLGESDKAVTVSAVEFSQKGFQFFYIPTKDIDFNQHQAFKLTAIAGSRNLTFPEPIGFEVKWRNIDLRKKRVYVGCEIKKITSTSEEQFIAFIEKEFKFAGQWSEGRRSELKCCAIESEDIASPDSPTGRDNRFESIFNNSHTVMILIDPDNADIVEANPAAVAFYGWSHKELTAKKINEINTLSAKQIFKEMKKAKGGQRKPFCFQHRLANGEIRHVEVFSGPISCSGKQMLYSIVHDVTDRKKAEAEREKMVTELQDATQEIRTLKRILPLCSYCNKIRDAEGHWERFEVYLGKHYQTDISHGICPDCARKHYPGLINKLKL